MNLSKKLILVLAAAFIGMQVSYAEISRLVFSTGNIDKANQYLKIGSHVASENEIEIEYIDFEMCEVTSGVVAEKVMEEKLAEETVECEARGSYAVSDLSRRLEYFGNNETMQNIWSFAGKGAGYAITLLISQFLQNNVLNDMIIGENENSDWSITKIFKNIVRFLGGKGLDIGLIYAFHNWGASAVDEQIKGVMATPNLLEVLDLRGTEARLTVTNDLDELMDAIQKFFIVGIDGR